MAGFDRKGGRRPGRRLGVEVLEGRELLAPFTVTNTDDSGPGSLRQAILDANAHGGGDTIDFDIAPAQGETVVTIQPLSALPAISDPLTIDGYTQGGASPNSRSDGEDAALTVVLDGSKEETHQAAGLTIVAGSSTVRGLVIAQFGGGGIVLDQDGGNTIAGNFIGTDATGTAARFNAGDGVSIKGGASNTIGGTTPGARNVIAGAGDDVAIATAFNAVQGNFLGTDASGTRALGGQAGVNLLDASDNTVGGPAVGAGNLISGNAFGVSIQSTGGDPRIATAARNVVQGNLIGVDVGGRQALGNNVGVRVLGSNLGGGQLGGQAAGNTIGGAAAEARNVISGNNSAGLTFFSGASNNQVLGNFIGTDATGQVALGNGPSGNALILDGVVGNTVGGAAGAGNVISGNAHGIMLEALTAATLDNVIQGNLIGTTPDGNGRLGNAGPGIVVGVDRPSFDLKGTVIGGNDAGLGNTIADNGAGVSMAGATTVGTAILGNSIHDNAGPGISSTSPATPNAPILASAVVIGNDLRVRGTVTAAPSTTFVIQVYANPAGTPTGQAEGQTFVGRVLVASDPRGSGYFNTTIPGAGVAPGQVLTITATDPANGTSPFSGARAAVTPNSGFATTPGDYDGDGKTDTVVYDAAGATFFVQYSGGGGKIFPFGVPNGQGLPIAGDFDGDGRTDFAVYDPQSTQFFILNSSGGGKIFTFGVPNGRGIPIAGDFDGDGRTDIAVYDPASTNFFTLFSGGGGKIFTFGVPNGRGVPIGGDFDGDGRTDFATYDPVSTNFFTLYSGGGGKIFTFGVPNGQGLPIAGDYDGDGKTDIAVYDPASTNFFIQASSAGGRIFTFGPPGGVGLPIAGDFDGDGRTDVAVYDPSASNFFIRNSNGGGAIFTFGIPDGQGVPSPATVPALASRVSTAAVAAGTEAGQVLAVVARAEPEPATAARGIAWTRFLA